MDLAPYPRLRTCELNATQHPAFKARPGASRGATRPYCKEVVCSTVLDKSSAAEARTLAGCYTVPYCTPSFLLYGGCVESLLMYSCKGSAAEARVLVGSWQAAHPLNQACWSAEVYGRYIRRERCPAGLATMAISDEDVFSTITRLPRSLRKITWRLPHLGCRSRRKSG